MTVEFDRLKGRVLAVVAVFAAGVLLSVMPSVKEVLAEPLRIGISRDIKTALIRLADAQGFFKKRSVDIVTKEYDSGALAVNDLLAGKIDVATASEFVFVVQHPRHPDLRVFATICRASDNDFVVRKDRAAGQPPGLKGRRVAIPPGTIAEFFFHNYLIFNGIPVESVQVVDTMPSQMVKAIVDGTVDAALCWPPFTVEMIKGLGANGLRWPAQSGQDYYFALVAKEGFLKKQSRTMEQFLAALSEAEEFTAKYPDRTQTIVLSRLKADRETLLPTQATYRFRLQLTQDLLVLMERETKWAIRNKLVERKEIPNYLDFIYFEALDKAKPAGVSIVH